MREDYVVFFLLKGEESNFFGRAEMGLCFYFLTSSDLIHIHSYYLEYLSVFNYLAAIRAGACSYFTH